MDILGSTRHIIFLLLEFICFSFGFQFCHKKAQLWKDTLVVTPNVKLCDVNDLKLERNLMINPLILQIKEFLYTQKI